MKRFIHNARRITAVAAVVGAFMLAPAIARASAGSPARPYAIAVTPLCQTPGLVIWLDTTGNGAAGTTFYKLHFTNLSGHACSLNGFPFLFAVNLTGHQVGPRAVFRLPPTPHLVTLANGKTATAVLGIVDTGVFSRSACRPVTAAGLRVFPPNQNQVQACPVPLQYLFASARAGLAQRGSGYQIAPRRAICRLCRALRKNRYGGQAPRPGPVRGAGPLPRAATASDQVRAFAGMLIKLTGQDLPQWIADASDAGLPGISSFAKGLKQDLDAITNGLTMPWSSGPVEGRVNHKMIKRQMFGRAGLPLLRKRALLTARS